MTKRDEREMVIKKHNKRMIIGENSEGWWAVDPEPALKYQDLDKLKTIVEGVKTREKLISFLQDAGYRPENIVEGVLRK